MIAISTDGLPIAYEVAGSGSPLLMLHGFSDIRQSWRDCGYVDAFVRAGRQVILTDARGHGESGKPHHPAAYSMRQRVEDGVAVLDALGASDADVAGFSMGGATALALGQLFPDRIRSITVIGAHPGAQDLSPYRRALAGGAEHWLALIEAQGVRLSPEQRNRIGANDFRALAACIAHDRPDSSGMFASSQIPLLTIAGTDDPMFAAVRRFAELARARFLPLEGRNHFTAFLAVDVIVPAMNAIFTRQDRETGQC
jgi:pimeloyl-ACP methyl ester carboxylesterase